MQKILIITLLFCSIYATAQDETTGWSVGVSAQPANYWLYNDNDWNTARFELKPTGNSIEKINAIAGGITAAYQWHENWAVQTELMYSTQQQNYTAHEPFATIKGYTQLNYLKLPISVAYYIPMQTENANFVYFNMGVQGSFLTSYYQESHYLNEPNGPQDDYKVVWQNQNLTYNQYATSMFTQPGSSSHVIDWAFNRFVFGGIFSVGWRRVFSNNLTLSVGLRSEYDITNADNLGAKIHTDNSPIWSTGVALDGNNTANSRVRPVSHNIRAGLELGLSYHFE